MRIYFTVDANNPFYVVLYLDASGNTHEQNVGGVTVDLARRKFEETHPRAHYVSWKNFEARKLQAAQDRAKLSAWKEWAI